LGARDISTIQTDPYHYTRGVGEVMKINPGTLAPPVMGLYSQIAVASKARLAFIAGQVAIDRHGEFVGHADYGAQARQCFLNIAAAIQAVGAQPSDLLRMTVHVVNHQPELIAVIFNAGKEVFPGTWPSPASTYLGVACLALPEWLIEIDAVVGLP
jgi:enamine deaminase RidA (YjgF/YER057c/UK114 family)